MFIHLFPLYHSRIRYNSNTHGKLVSSMLKKEVKVKVDEFLFLSCFAVIVIRFWMGIKWVQALCLLTIETSTNLSWSGLTLRYGWSAVSSWSSTWDISTSQPWCLLSRSSWPKSSLISSGKHLRISVSPGSNSWTGTCCLYYIGSDDLLIILLTRVCLFSLQALLFHCHAFRVWQDP